MSCFGRPDSLERVNNDPSSKRRKSSSSNNSHGLSTGSSTNNNNSNNNGNNNNNQQNPNNTFNKVVTFCLNDGDCKTYINEAERVVSSKDIPFIRVQNDYRNLVKRLESCDSSTLVLMFFEVHEQDKLDHLINDIQAFERLNPFTFSIFLVGNIQSITKANTLRVKLVLKGAVEHTRARLKIYPICAEQSIRGGIDFILSTAQQKTILDESTEELFKKFKEHFGSPVSSHELSGREIADWLKAQVKPGVFLDDSQAVGYGQKLVQYCIIRHTERAKPFCCSPKVFYELVKEKSGMPKYNPPPEW